MKESSEQEVVVEGVSKENAEVLSVATEKEVRDGDGKVVERIPVDAETRERERQKSMAEIKASISPEGEKSLKGTSTAAGGAAILIPKDEKKEAGGFAGGGGGIGSKLWRGVVKGFAFMGVALEFGFGLVLATGVSIADAISKIKSGKGGGKGHAGGSGHKKHDAGHGAHKDSGGHAAKEKAHDAGGHH